MALLKRGSRRIVVDGTAYRWRLRGRPTYDQGLCASPCTYAVERAGGQGAVLVVMTDQPHPGNWIGRRAQPVLPSDVSRAIHTALAGGWRPDHPGSAFHLDQSAGFVQWT